MATVTPGPFASYHARREWTCPKTNPFLPSSRCMEEGIRAERIVMADLEQFSEEAGRYGSRVWEVWKIRRVITQAIYQHSTPITRSLSPENYPLKCPHLVMLPLLGPLEPRSIRLWFRGCSVLTCIVHLITKPGYIIWLIRRRAIEVVNVFQSIFYKITSWPDKLLHCFIFFTFPSFFESMRIHENQPSAGW